MSKQNFDAAGDYSCQTVYMYSLGQLESPSFTVFVQGFISFLQVGKQGGYNEVGETLTFTAIIKAKTQPSQFILTKNSVTVTPSNTPIAALMSGKTDEWQATVEVLADVKGPAVYKLMSENIDHITIDSANLNIYEKCTLPSVDGIALLDGSDLNHMEERGDLQCASSQTISGSTSVTCNDGTLEWASPDAVEPECISIGEFIEDL